jgi:hypothetical protein
MRPMLHGWTDSNDGHLTHCRGMNTYHRHLLAGYLKNLSRAMAVLAAYYIVTAMTLASGRQGNLPPLMAGWLGPTIFVAAIGLF